MGTIRIISEPDASQDDIARIETGLNEFNMAVSIVQDYRPVVILLRDTDEAVAGGLIGNRWGAWLHVRHLWIAERLRHQGYGSRLLRMAEEEATATRCRGAFLDTFSFQARPFYERNGYECFGELGDHPPGHSHCFMRKLLKK
jgi:GNAT superfamily N-acetyltransferase